MLKKYSFCAELLVIAKSYFDQGRNKEAAKLAYKALAEEDAKEFVDVLDEENQILDPTAEEEVDEEVLSDEDFEEILKDETTEEAEPEEEVIEETEEAPEEETAEEEAPTEEVEEEKIEELPEVDEVLSKVAAKKQTLANLASLSGKNSSRRAAIDKFLKK